MIIAVDGSKRPVTTKAGDIAFQRKGITHIEEGTSDAPLRAEEPNAHGSAGRGGRTVWGSDSLIIDSGSSLRMARTRGRTRNVHRS